MVRTHAGLVSQAAVGVLAAQQDELLQRHLVEHPLPAGRVAVRLATQQPLEKHESGAVPERVAPVDELVRPAREAAKVIRLSHHDPSLQVQRRRENMHIQVCASDEKEDNNNKQIARRRKESKQASAHQQSLRINNIRPAHQNGGTQRAERVPAVCLHSGKARKSAVVPLTPARKSEKKHISHSLKSDSTA